MKDYCLRATAANGHIRAFAATTRHLADEAAKIHGTTPVASAALGRLLTATAIMGLMAGNDDDLITVVIKGDGPIGGALATSDGLGRVRGYVHNPKGDIAARPDGKLNVGGAIGAGHITVIKDLGLKEPYVGTLALVSGEVAEDVAGYFAFSEQMPSIVSLGVLVERDHSIKQAGGFLLQLMPGFDEALIDVLEAKMANFPAITVLLEQGKTPEDVLDMLLSDFGYEIAERSPLEFYCNCDRGRVTGALVAMGAQELGQIIKEDGKAEVSCHFCNKRYVFERDELTEILENSM
ncbi:MAG: Hsp33 family molecular chaperone HslO [Clostridiales bacterium]|jgi:molecular chaperone Hsp33|nr:Hsp33 family molecular chaperone HslO [Clostridiales bacterium]